MSLVDSHCHIDFEPLREQLPALLANCRENGVDHLMAISVCWEDFPQVRELAETHPEIFASVGVHPCYDNHYEPSLDELLHEAAHPKVVAIGETGLDYFHIEARTPWQTERFVRHIQAAKQAQLPLIIHTRNAADDTLDILESEHARDAQGVMHCFAEDWGIAKRALDIGFYLSFSGIVTFKSAKAIQEVAQKAPLDRILVETDSPYLAPVPFRGKQNQPAYVRHTAEYVASLRQMPYQELAAATTENYFNLFNKAAPLRVV